MLEKPSIPDHKIAACLQADYSITAVHITFFPLGADQNTAVYHIQVPNHQPCFLKLRSGPQDRQQALRWLKSNYTPNSTIDLALR